MCRIAGLLSPNNLHAAANRQIVQQMNDLQAHGGPDGAGILQTEGLTLGHRRLAIIEPGAAASQPFSDHRGLLSYNGELYNYPALRGELETAGEVFTTDSDTEVVFRALARWGVTAASRFNGMFALAYWSVQDQCLLLARDHAGMKPLYYGDINGTLVFASELKAFRACPGFVGTVDHQAVNQFMRRGYIGAPRTIFEEVAKVMPGTALRFSKLGELQETIQLYQLPAPVTATEKANPLVSLKERLDGACAGHLLADVPVGVFLSGGVDSSVLAATAQRVSDYQLKTFTLGFRDGPYDEAPAAEAIAAHLGTKHQTFYAELADLASKIPLLSEVYDEPFGDASALATLLLAEQTATEVKCVIGGDGGDELFGGYTKYRATRVFAVAQRYAPGSLLPALGRCVGRVAPDRWKKLLGLLSPQGKTAEERFAKLIQAMQADHPADFFDQSSDYTSPELLDRLGLAPRIPVAEWRSNHHLYQMAVHDLKNFLEGDLLVKVDRASMRYGLEVRLPFLDKDMIRFGLQLPAALKIRNGEGKILLRRALADLLPGKLISRRKDGFSIPIKELLLGHLRGQLQEMAYNTGFSNRFGFTAGAVESIVSDFLQGRRYVNAYPVWFLYTLYQWNRSWSK